MVSSIGSYNSSAAMTRMRPDPADIASKLFSKLDTKGQGYLQESDLASALGQLSPSSGSTARSAGSDASALFQALDSDSDGKLTASEFSSSIQKLAEALDSQASDSRLAGARGHHGGPQGAGGMPPPPPPPADDSGFTQDQLSSQLSQAASSSDSQRSRFISDLVSNFDKADSDGDGKVSMTEAMAYQHSTQDSASTSSSAASGSARSSEAALMHQVMELVRAYGAGNDPSGNSGSLSASA